MGRVRGAMGQWVAAFRRGKIGREVDEEVRAHLEMATEENRRRGLSEEDARLTALRDFGGAQKSSSPIPGRSPSGRSHPGTHPGTPRTDRPAKSAIRIRGNGVG